MKTSQVVWESGRGWSGSVGPCGDPARSFALALGARDVLTAERMAEARAMLGGASLVACTTAGEIAGERA